MDKFSDCDIDAQTLAAARRGRPEACEAIHREYAGAVFTLALRILGHREAAEEALQDTFVEVLRNIGAFRGEAPLGAWVRRIAVNKALGQLRSAWHRYARSLDGHAEPATTEAGGDRLDIARALASLDPVARAVVWLHDVEGYTHREIGELMQRSPSFSKSQLARAYKRMRAGAQPNQDSSSCMPILNNC